jgi:hypothetical protein
MAAYKLKIIKTQQDARELLKEIKRYVDDGLYSRGDVAIYNLYCSQMYNFMMKQIAKLLIDSLNVNARSEKYICHAGFNSVGGFEFLLIKEGKRVNFVCDWIEVNKSAYCSDTSIMSGGEGYGYSCPRLFDEALTKINDWNLQLMPILKDIKKGLKNAK